MHRHQFHGKVSRHVTNRINETTISNRIITPTSNRDKSNSEALLKRHIAVRQSQSNIFTIQTTITNSIQKLSFIVQSDQQFQNMPYEKRLAVMEKQKILLTQELKSMNSVATMLIDIKSQENRKSIDDKRISSKNIYEHQKSDPNMINILRNEYQKLNEKLLKVSKTEYYDQLMLQIQEQNHAFEELNKKKKQIQNKITQNTKLLTRYTDKGINPDQIELLKIPLKELENTKYTIGQIDKKLESIFQKPTIYIQQEGDKFNKLYIQLQEECYVLNIDPKIVDGKISKLYPKLEEAQLLRQKKEKKKAEANNLISKYNLLQQQFSSKQKSLKEMYAVLQRELLLMADKLHNTNIKYNYHCNVRAKILNNKIPNRR